MNPRGKLLSKLQVEGEVAWSGWTPIRRTQRAITLSTGTSWRRVDLRYAAPLIRLRWLLAGRRLRGHAGDASGRMTRRATVRGNPARNTSVPS